MEMSKNNLKSKPARARVEGRPVKDSHFTASGSFTPLTRWLAKG